MRENPRGTRALSTSCFCVLRRQEAINNAAGFNAVSINGQRSTTPLADMLATAKSIDFGLAVG